MGGDGCTFLGNAGSPQQPALEAAIKRGPAFFADAVAMAQKNGYDGYSMDQELRCTLDAHCWAKMAPLAKPYMSFLNAFADELHKHGMILSVFIDGCCNYTNPYDTANRGCKGAEAKYDYQAVQCS